jgi:signal transduction histidine kinase
LFSEVEIIFTFRLLNRNFSVYKICLITTLAHTKNINRLSLGFLSFLFISLMACESKNDAKKLVTKHNLILISEDFESQNINQFVKFSTNFKESDLKRKNLRQYLMQNFTPKLNNKEIALGKASDSNYGWVYFEIFNQTAHKQTLTLETDHIRCDGIEAYTLEKDSVKFLTKIKRQTPLVERDYPILTFAFPLKIESKDTLKILLRSERYSGINVLDLTLSQEKKFIKNSSYEVLNAIFQISFILVAVFFMLSFGIIFRHKLLLYNGFFIFGMMLAIANNYFFFDQITFPKILTLNQANVGSLVMYITNALYHPFGKQLFKRLPINQRRYRLWANVLTILNVLAMFGILFIHDKIVGLTPFLYTYLTLINLLWVLYHALLALVKARVYSYLIVFSFIFLPIIIPNFLALFNIQANEYTLNFSFLSTPIIIIALAYLSIDNFRKELISKDNYDKNLNLMRQNIEEIRKSEVNNIGRNLHDNVGNTLLTVLGYLNLKNMDIDKMKRLLTDSINEVRFLSHNLVKDDERPIREKIESLVNRFNDFSAINFQFVDFSEGKINHLQLVKQNNIYMIIQEVVSNIIKHSKAQEASIQIFAHQSYFEINIEDDGIGMDKNSSKHGIGIQNIYKRADLSNLKIIIDSTPNGTSFIIEIPHENENNNH